MHKMARGNLFRPQLHGKIEKRLELNLPVTQYIRVGRTASLIFIQKQRENTIPILLGKIDGIVWNINLLAHLLHIAPVAFGSAYAVFVLFLPIFIKTPITS